MTYQEGALATGSTSVSVLLPLPAQLTHVSAGLGLSYTRTGAAPVPITAVTQTATGGYSSGGFCPVDATNIPELHRLDLPNTVLVSGADTVTIGVTASGMLPRYFTYSLRDVAGVYGGAIASGTNTPTTITTTLGYGSDKLNRRVLEFTSGACSGQVVAIVKHDGAGVFELAPPLTTAPSVADRFHVR